MKDINDNFREVTIDNIETILLYADDSTLIASDEISLNCVLDVVSKWCSKWRLSVNPDTIKVVHFRSSTTQRPI